MLLIDHHFRARETLFSIALIAHKVIEGHDSNQDLTVSPGNGAARNVAVGGGGIIPGDEHRTNPRAFDFRARQAKSCNRGLGNSCEAPWQAAQEAAGGFINCIRAHCSEAERPQPSEAKGTIGADEGLLGEAEEAGDEGLVKAFRNGPSTVQKAIHFWIAFC